VIHKSRAIPDLSYASGVENSTMLAIRSVCTRSIPRNFQHFILLSRESEPRHRNWIPSHKEGVIVAHNVGQIERALVDDEASCRLSVKCRSRTAIGC